MRFTHCGDVHMEAPNAQGITLHTAGRSRTAEICYLQLESHINSFVYQMYSGHMIGKKIAPLRVFRYTHRLYALNVIFPDKIKIPSTVHDGWRNTVYSC